jgi:hypothetical protein
MSPRMWFFVLAVVLFVVSLALVAVISSRRARKASRRDWNHLLNRLTVVDRGSIAEVALDLVDESGERRRDQDSATLEPAKIWSLVGGLKGLEVLESNCAVLIDLAFYVQQWHPEALLVAEQLRLSAREIAWHVDRLRSALKTGKLESAFPMYAPRAVAVYYIMTRKLLALYEQGGGPMLRDLEKAI